MVPYISVSYFCTSYFWFFLSLRFPFLTLWFLISVDPMFGVSYFCVPIFVSSYLYVTLKMGKRRLDLVPAKVHELAPGIHYWKEEEGASPRAFLSLASRRFHCTVNLGDQSRIPSRSLPICPGVLIELTTLAQLLLISSSRPCSKCRSCPENLCSTSCLA